MYLLLAHTFLNLLLWTRDWQLIEKLMEETSANLAEDLLTVQNALAAFWEHFGFCAEDIRQKEVKCKLCRAVSTTVTNTINLFLHIIK